MSILRLLIPFAIVALPVLGVAHGAKADTSGQPCSEVGKTSLSDDQRDMMACLYDAHHNLVWKSLIMPSTAAALPAALPVNDPRPAETTREDLPASSTKHWQGWYAGGNAGLSHATNSVMNGSLTTDIPIYSGTFGLVGGYNHVDRSGLFYGGEADINYMANQERRRFSAKGAWRGYATARGRIGVAFDPAIIFLSGGLAVSDVANEGHLAFSTTGIATGWVLGGGTEVALTNQISVGLQYLMIGMPEHRVIASFPGPTNKEFISESANILRVGMNWHFD